MKFIATLYTFVFISRGVLFKISFRLSASRSCSLFFINLCTLFMTIAIHRAGINSGYNSSPLPTSAMAGRRQWIITKSSSLSLSLEFLVHSKLWFASNESERSSSNWHSRRRAWRLGEHWILHHSKAVPSKRNKLHFDEFKITMTRNRFAATSMNAQQQCEWNSWKQCSKGMQ